MSFVRTMTGLGPRYRALWIGQTISQFGTYVAFLTLPLLVRAHPRADPGAGSTLDYAIAYALETAPTVLVGLVAGVLLDRLNLRPVMIATDLIRASAFFYLTANLDNYGVVTVFVVAFLIGSMTTLFDGALYTMIPALVPKERLAQANGFVAASQQANFALGPLAAGVLAYHHRWAWPRSLHQWGHLRDLCDQPHLGWAGPAPPATRGRAGGVPHRGGERHSVHMGGAPSPDHHHRRSRSQLRGRVRRGDLRGSGGGGSRGPDRDRDRDSPRRTRRWRRGGSLAGTPRHQVAWPGKDLGRGNGRSPGSVCLR